MFQREFTNLPQHLDPVRAREFVIKKHQRVALLLKLLQRCFGSLDPGHLEGQIRFQGIKQLDQYIGEIRVVIDQQE